MNAVSHTAVGRLYSLTRSLGESGVSLPGYRVYIIGGGGRTRQNTALSGGYVFAFVHTDTDRSSSAHRRPLSTPLSTRSRP